MTTTRSEPPLNTGNPSFSFVVNGRDLKTFLAPAHELDVDDIVLSVTREGLAYQAVDPAHIMLVDITYHASPEQGERAIRLFRPPSKDVRFVLNLAKLKETLETLGNPHSELVVFGTWNPRRNNGHLHLEARRANGSVPLADPGNREQAQLPPKRQSARATLKTADLLAALAHAKDETHVVRLNLTADAAFHIFAEGSAKRLIRKLEGTELESVEVRRGASAKYLAGFLHDLVKTIPSETVEVALSTRSTLRLTWENSQGQGRLLLAPLDERS